MKALKWTAGIVFLLAAAWVGLLSLREPWVTPISGVRLEPSRPHLRREDADPDSAFGLLQQACDLSAFDLRDAEREWSEVEEAGAGEPGVWADPEKLPATRALLPHLEGKLDLCRRAVRKEGPRAPTVQDFSTDLSYLTHSRQLARLLRSRAAFRWAEGDAQGAYDDVESGLRLGVLVSNGGCIVNHLVGVSVTLIACRTLWAMTVEDDWRPTPASGRLKGVLSEVEDGADPFAECMRYEWLGMHRSLAGVLADPGGSSVKTLVGDLGPLAGFIPVFGALVGSSPKRVMRDLDYCYGHMIREAERPAWAGGPRFSLRQRNPLVVQDPIGHVLACMLIPAFAQARGKAEARFVFLRGMRTFLAVREFELTQGPVPSDLGELTPALLESVPLDPFDGKPLRYGCDTDGNWRVWSVGSDGRDDGGVAPGWCDARQADLVIPGRRGE